MREKTSNFVFPRRPGTGATKILIVEESHKPGQPFGEPGGKREESDPSDYIAASRELTEETGYQAIVEEEPFISVRDGYKVRQGFGAVIVGGERRTTPNHQYIGWFALQDLESLYEIGRLRGQWVLDFANAFMERESGLSVPQLAGLEADSGLSLIEARELIGVS